MEKNYREPLTAEELREHKSDCSGSPSIYCGTYRKYNDGNLFGMWIDLTSFYDYDEFIEFCERLHADEADPELMFQDYECFPRSWYCESCMGEELFDKIKEYADLDKDERDAFDAYVNCTGDESVEDFKEKYVGHYTCPEDFAEQLITDCYDLSDLPDIIHYCIDWKAVWRNLETSGDYSEQDGYIFRNY